MAKQTNNLLFFDSVSGLPQVINNDSIALSGDLEIGGNLTIQGTMTYVDSEILTSDAYLLMNSDYAGTTVQNGGIVINTKMNTTPGALVSVDNATNTVVVQGTGYGLIAGDIFALQGSTDSRNDSLYEVASSDDSGGVNTSVVLKATVTSTYGELLRSSSELVDEGNTAGAVGGKVTVGILRSDVAAGTFEYGIGSNTNMSFSDIAASSLDLQTAYNNGTSNLGGEMILLTAAKGDLTIAPAPLESVAISLEASSPSKFEVTSADTLDLKTAGGTLRLTSTAGNLTGTVPNTQILKMVSGTSEALNAVYGRLRAQGNVVDITSSGAGSSISIAGQGGIGMETTGGDVTIGSSTGAISVSGSTDVTIDSDATLSAIADGKVTITSGLTGAGAEAVVTASGGDLTLKTIPDAATGNTTTGVLKLNAAQTTDAGGKSLTITSTGAMSTSVADGAYSVTTTNTSVASPIEFTANTANINMAATGDITAVASGTARDVIISSIGGPALGSVDTSGLGGEVIVHTDLLDINTSIFDITGVDHGGVLSSGNIQTSGDLTFSSTAANLSASTPFAGDLTLTSGSAALGGRLLLNGNLVSLSGLGAGGTLALSGQTTASLTAIDSALTLEATNLNVAISAGTNIGLIAGNAITANSTGATSVSAGTTFGLTSAQDAIVSTTDGNISVTANSSTSARSLTLSTVSGGSAAGSLDVTGATTTSVTAGAGALTLGATNGNVAISATNGGTPSAITLTTNTNDVTVSSGNNITLSADTNAAVNISAGAVTDTGSIGLTAKAVTIASETTTVTSTLGSSVTSTTAGVSLTAATTVALDGSTSITLTAPQNVIKGDDAAQTQQVQLLNSDSTAVIEVERDGSDFVGARLNQSVSVGSSLPNISGVSDVGVGVRVTVEPNVEIGHVLAINANGRFDKALARRANEGDSDLPQNPIGVLLANGQAAATTSGVFMSTVHGATALVQLTSAPAAGDVGATIFLSPTVSGKGIITSNPLSLVEGDGLTRVSQIGILLSSTAISVTGLTGSVDVYPILWNVDHVAEA